MLLLQSVLPVALFATHACDITLGGGTNADNAPPVDYFQQVFLPMATSLGIEADLQLIKR